MPHDLIAIGAYLQELRQRRQWSRSALGEAAGISERTVLNWEQGHCDDLKLLQLRHIVSLLGGTMNDIDTLLATAHPAAEYGVTLARRRCHLNTQRPRDPNEKPVFVVQLAGPWLSQTRSDLSRCSHGHRARPGTRWYEGHHTGIHGDAVLVNGVCLREACRQRGIAVGAFTWGRVGSGALALARAILACEMCDQVPLSLTHRFAQDILVAIPQTHWMMDGEVVHQWLALVDMVGVQAEKEREVAGWSRVRRVS